MPPSNKDDLIRVRVESALKEAAEEMAEERGERLSVIVRELLRQAIADWKASNSLHPAAKPPGTYRNVHPAPSPRLNEDSTNGEEEG